MHKSKLEFTMELHLKAAGVAYETEYHFHPERKWRFDFAIPAERIGIEVEGGIWTQGAHTRGTGFSEDCEKYNAATIEGWSVLRYTAKTLHQCTDDIGKILARRREKFALQSQPKQDSSQSQSSTQ